jgi:hypothetical protein
MSDLDGLIATYLARNPERGLKRLREVVFEEIWREPGEDTPDFSLLPKDVWGMIVKRCAVSRDSLTTLLLLNKARLSAIVWSHFPFSPTWNYKEFMRRLMHAPKYRSLVGWTKQVWTIYGFDRAVAYINPVKDRAISFVPELLVFIRSTPTPKMWYGLMHMLSSKLDILTCVTRLLSLYRPEIDSRTICALLYNLGCSYEGERPTIALKTHLVPLPEEFSALTTKITNVHVALGYYNTYREYALRDYGLTLPEIKFQ